MIKTYSPDIHGISDINFPNLSFIFKYASIPSCSFSFNNDFRIGHFDAMIILADTFNFAGSQSFFTQS